MDQSISTQNLLLLAFCFDDAEGNIEVVAGTCLASFEYASIRAPPGDIFGSRLLTFACKILKLCRQVCTLSRNQIIIVT